MIHVVLVEPEGDENIGAVTRSMKNFGIIQLILVNPQCDYLSDGAKNYSIHAKDILESAITYETLKDSLNNMQISIALSRRIGQWRKRDLMISELPEFLSHYHDKNVALVFGRETQGLTNDEIRMCDLICSIPTSEQFPSMNLSHAVTVTLYELFQHQNEYSIENMDTIADREVFEQMMNQIFITFKEMEFFKNVPEWRLRNYINKLLLRAKLDAWDAKAIKNIFRRMEGIAMRLKSDGNRKDKNDSYPEK